MTQLSILYVFPGNAGVMCAPTCLSSVANTTLPSTLCVTEQDRGLCAFIAATSISTFISTSMWSCTSMGLAATNPCTWNGLTCAGNVVTQIALGSSGMTGIDIYIPDFYSPDGNIL